MGEARRPITSASNDVFIEDSNREGSGERMNRMESTKSLEFGSLPSHLCRTTKNLPVRSSPDSHLAFLREMREQIVETYVKVDFRGSVPRPKLEFQGMLVP